MTILVLNGVNLNMLGVREPGIYGNESLTHLEESIKEYCMKEEIEVSCKQTNYEGQMVEWIQSADVDGIVINPGAWTHYSYAIRDAIASIQVPVVEVHISNIYKRETFRHHSVIKDVCEYSIVGEGFEGYNHAIDYLKEKTNES